MKTLSVGIEDWNQVWPDVNRLGADYFSHNPLDPRRPYRLDVEMVSRLQDAGLFRLLCARLDGTLIGFITWHIGTDIQSKGLMIASQGAWLVEKGFEELHIGRRLFEESIEELTKLGVQVMFPHCGPDDDLGRFFENLGANREQVTYSLWLEEKKS